MIYLCVLNQSVTPADFDGGPVLCQNLDCLSPLRPPLERTQKSFELLLLLISQVLKVPRQIHVAFLRLHFVPADRFVERER